MNNIFLIAKNKKNVEEYIESLKKKYEISSVEEISLENDYINEVLTKLNMTSLFSSKKIILIKDLEQFEELNKNELMLLKKYLENSNPSYYAIFWFLEKKNKNYRELVKYVKEEVKDYNLETYIKRLNKKIDQELVKEIKEYDKDIESQINMLDVLLLYSDNPTVKDLELFYTKSINDNIFDLVNAITKKNKKLAIRLYKEYQKQNINIDYIYNLLITKFQDLYNLKVLSKTYKRSDLENLLDVSSGRLYYMLKEVEMLELEDIKKNLESLNQLEYDIKKGIVRPEVGIELYLVNG